MGSYQICDYCGNLVQKTKDPMCRECKEQFVRVRDMVAKQPNITVQEVYRHTGVAINKIHLFAERGWFILNKGAIEATEEKE